MSTRKEEWFLLRAMVYGEERISVEEAPGDLPPVLTSRLFDADGEPVLCVVKMPLGAVTMPQLGMMQQVLQAQFQTPVIIVDTSIEFLRAVKMSDVEVRRHRDKMKKINAGGN